MNRATKGKVTRLVRLMGLGLVMALLGAGSAAAKNGRDFAGIYHITNVTDAGDSYSFTFKARVMNYSGAGIKDAFVILRGSDLPRQDYAVFSGVNMADHQHATVSGTATVPKREYDRWQRGAHPVLMIQYKDSNGDTHEKRVELARRPVE